jgi:hypothetical protein
MSSQPSRRLRPLNVGDVVSAGISLLRSHFRTYLGLSLRAVLWFLIPVYGWAKGLMICGQIGRLGFQDVVHQPEAPAAALRSVKPRLWSFLGVAILVVIIQLAVNYAIAAAAGLLMLPLMTIGAAGGAIAELSGLLVVILQLAIFVAQTWFQARFWLYDMIIAVETETESTRSISRSWELTKGSATRVMFVLLVSYVVMMPLFVLTAAPFLLTIPFAGSFGVEGPEPVFALALSVAALVFLVLLFFTIVLTIPFWQSIKSVLYYDLRSRREGLDIQFSDRPRDRNP